MVKIPKTLSADLSAGLVVFLVALPLCLGIANASGVPPLYGLVAGAIGGIVIGAVSKSPLSVSGPAAGLVAIVLTALTQLNNNLAAFQLAVLIAGAIQIVLGALRLGVVASFIPNSVIKGMLAGIGIVIILKQIPHALGWDKDYEGDFAFLSKLGNTFADIAKAVVTASPGAVIIFLIGAAIIMLWETPKLKAMAFTKFIPGALVAVILGGVINQLFQGSAPSLSLKAIDHHLVEIPDLSTLMKSFRLPDWSAISNSAVWTIALTIAIVASVETLLSIDAADKLDSQRRVTPANRELIAQGIGNTICGLVGGIPVTSVVVRSSANAYAGGKTQLSTIVHGVLLVVAAAFLGFWLNTIPLAALASVLILVGYKLTKPALYKKMYAEGLDQFLPFLITVLGVVFLDLLKGVAFGFIVGIVFVLKANHHRSFTLVNDGKTFLLRLNKDIPFTNKAGLLDVLNRVPDNVHLVVSGVKADFIDHDILETISDFTESGKHRGITVELHQIEGKTWNQRSRAPLEGGQN